MNEQQDNTGKQEPGLPQTPILIVEDSLIQAELLEAGVHLRLINHPPVKAQWFRIFSHG
jgi:hypothetical protein